MENGREGIDRVLIHRYPTGLLLPDIRAAGPGIIDDRANTADASGLAIARVMRLVLDTNVVLDWLLFEDAALDPLRLAVLEGRVSLVSLAQGMDELHRVLQYPKFGLDPTRQQEVLTQYARASAPLPELTRDNVLPAGFPRCRDSDDDPFVALAYFARADALVSKDKQVLRLRKKAAKFGVVVLTPVQLITLMTAMRTNMSTSDVVDQETGLQ